MTAKRTRATGAEAVTLEPVLTPADRGWLRAEEAVALLRATFGASVSKRTIQGWARDPKRPLRSIRIGHRLYVLRSDVLAHVAGTDAEAG